jgi:hypothetical protein
MEETKVIGVIIFGNLKLDVTNFMRNLFYARLI